jgi:hypothetical protein
VAVGESVVSTLYFESPGAGICSWA